MILNFILSRFIKLIARILFRMKINGNITIPKSGGALLVANHTSYLDFILMVAASPRPVHFIMNEDIFRKPFLRPLLQALNCIPIGPRGHKNDLEAFNKSVISQVNQGKVVAIFAEGTVSRTGQLLEFKKGVEHLSKLICGPVIPIHFDNVSGSPFTYRAGKRSMIPLRLRHFGRKVYVRFGEPIFGGITAFHLRQRIKELEVVNFQDRVKSAGSIQKRLSASLSKSSNGFWSWGNESLLYRDISIHLSQLNTVLYEALRHEQRLAVLLPNGKWSHVVHLWLLLQRKTAVPISQEWTNEERYFVMNRSNTGVLITTKDLNFTKFAPTSENVIYIEDIISNIESGKKGEQFCSTWRWAKKQVRATFLNKRKEEPALILFEKEADHEMKMVPVYGEQLSAVVTSMRQVYHFKSETVMSMRLSLENSFGYVLQLILPLLCDISVDARKREAGELFMEQLVEMQPEIVVATPSQLEYLAQIAQHRNLPFLTHVFTADIHPASEAVKSLMSRGIAVMTCAGMNASASVFAVNLHNYKGRDIVGKTLIQEGYDNDSIGKALPGVAVRVSKPNDCSVELGCEEIGALWIKGASIGEGEWLDTGWKGFIDHKGFIHLLDEHRGMAAEAC